MMMTAGGNNCLSINLTAFLSTLPLLTLSPAFGASPVETMHASKNGVAEKF
jgi:hypothetical protein